MMSAQCVPLPSSPGGHGPQRYPGYSYVSMQSTPLKQGLGLQRDRCSWKPEKGGQGVRRDVPGSPEVGADLCQHSPQTWHSMMVLRIRDISFTCKAAERGASGGCGLLAGTRSWANPTQGKPTLPHHLTWSLMSSRSSVRTRLKSVSCVTSALVCSPARSTEDKVSARIGTASWWHWLGAALPPSTKPGGQDSQLSFLILPGPHRTLPLQCTPCP